MRAATASEHLAERATQIPKDFVKGQVFTPRFLADWVSELLSERLGENWSGTILDPACGDGELLVAASDFLPKAKLSGIDIDDVACAAARQRLGATAKIICDDALINPRKRVRKIGAVISNPPWGADLLHTRHALQAAGFTLATGQFDSWSLFVEKSLRLLKQDGLGAFILPDAIFAPEHEQCRKLIADNYTIELVARLGEGIFRDVFRGTSVLLLRNARPADTHAVEVFRLSKTDRVSVVSGKERIAHLQKMKSYSLPQLSFGSDVKYRWSIDVKANELSTLRKLEASGGLWTERLVSGRGIELSKHGRVCACLKCGHAIPMPRTNRLVVCRGCGNEAHADEMNSETIVESATVPNSGFLPLVVGEDIDRYKLSCNRRIKLGVPGINYKSQQVYSKERLLVRKTGIGLKATVTKAPAATNQVVFHYLPKNEAEGFFLYYVLAVLSSRIMFAYHLRKSGEDEWRSHPYVTPKTLKELPIPLPKDGTQTSRQAKKISSLAKRNVEEGGRCKKLDLEIECYIAGLFGLTKTEIEWVKRVISSAQALEPMRALGNFSSDEVFPKVVA